MQLLHVFSLYAHMYIDTLKHSLCFQQMLNQWMCTIRFNHDRSCLYSVHCFFLTGHVWSAAGHYPALPFSLHTSWTSPFPLSLQWGVKCIVSCASAESSQPGSKHNSLPPFSALLLIPITTALPHTLQTTSWRVKLSRLWAILTSVFLFVRLYVEFGNHRVWGNGGFASIGIPGNWQFK